MSNLEYGSQALWRNGVLGNPIVVIDSDVRNDYVFIQVSSIHNNPRSSVFTERHLVRVDFLVPLPEKYTWDQLDALRSIIRV